jgi:hypothetical protein
LPSASPPSSPANRRLYQPSLWQKSKQKRAVSSGGGAAGDVYWGHNALSRDTPTPRRSPSAAAPTSRDSTPCSSPTKTKREYTSSARISNSFRQGT